MKAAKRALDIALRALCTFEIIAFYALRARWIRVGIRVCIHTQRAIVLRIQIERARACAAVLGAVARAQLAARQRLRGFWVAVCAHRSLPAEVAGARRGALVARRVVAKACAVRPALGVARLRAHFWV